MENNTQLINLICFMGNLVQWFHFNNRRDGTGGSIYVLLLFAFRKLPWLWFPDFNHGAARVITHEPRQHTIIEPRQQEYHCGGGFEHLHNDVAESALNDGCADERCELKSIYGNHLIGFGPGNDRHLGKRRELFFGKDGVDAILMGRPDDVYAVGVTYQGDKNDSVADHRALYLSLFGEDFKAGEGRRTQMRMVIGEFGSDLEKHKDLYQTFLNEVESKPRSFYINPEVK